MKTLRLALVSVIGACFAALLPAQETRLSNLSIRAQGGAGADLISGFTIGPGPNKTILVRAVGPTLGAFGVGGTLADPKLELYSGATKIAENDNWTAADAATFSSLGAFALGANSRDAAIVTTLSPGSYTAQVTGVGAGAGVVLIEVYEVTGGSTRLINLSTRAHVGSGDNILIPGITIAPGSGSRRLLIRAVGPTLGSFGVTGALANPRIELLLGTTKVAENDDWETPIGASTADAASVTAAAGQAGAFALNAGSRDAALLVNLSAGSYTLKVSGVGDTTGTALLEVYDLTPVNQTGARPSAALYIARLRPESSAASSTGSGFATIAINPDGSAFVNVTFSNLSSVPSAAHLQLGNGRDYVFNLPLGQVVNAYWTFEPTGAYTTNDLINALNTGNIFVGLDSAKYPGGELRGNFIQATGSQTFTPPAAPPALSAEALTKPSQTDAARFLTQATFGPTSAEIEALMSKGILAWIDEQMAIPASSHYQALIADTDAFPNPPGLDGSRNWAHSWNRVAVWWKVVLTGPDQLRQRVAFALSEIFVISDRDSTLAGIQDGVSKYYDILTQHAFGSFRQLLEDVTLSPMMGAYLSHVNNQKANPTKGSSPDENYAREVQQLFTIGLVQLHQDGTLLLDRSGQPIPTYDQNIVSETAKVFTGWSYAAPDNTFGRTPREFDSLGRNTATSGWVLPMQHFNSQHDKTEKRVVSLQQVPLEQAAPTIIPQNQTGLQDLTILLDTLFRHPNTGPFICRQLIQRLVTSNPSPGYIYRVAQVFANDGRGVRGNLGAVIRAILTDYEARSTEVVGNLGFGKIKEPLLKASQFFRVMKASAPNGRFLDGYFGDPNGFNGWFPSSWMGNTRGNYDQGPLQAPTVFNFFSPDYSPPGRLAAAGLVAPELQIVDATFAIQVPNLLLGFLHRTQPPNPSSPVPSPSPYLVLDFSDFEPLAASPEALLDRINVLFCANQMSTSTRSRILSLLPRFSGISRVRTAIHLTLLSQDYALQR